MKEKLNEDYEENVLRKISWSQEDIDVVEFGIEKQWCRGVWCREVCNTKILWSKKFYDTMRSGHYDILKSVMVWCRELQSIKISENQPYRVQISTCQRNSEL